VIRMFEPGELQRGAKHAPLFAMASGAAEQANNVPAREHASARAARLIKARQASLFDDDAHDGTDTPLSAELTAPPGTVPAAWAPTPLRSFLHELDVDHGAAAKIHSGPLLIVAGPGTGKTRTLPHRTAELIRQHGVPPQACLCVTFTRRAAEEMRE